jgi:hypothetical protein
LESSLIPDNGDRLSRYLKDNLGEKAVAILLEVNPDNTPGAGEGNQNASKDKNNSITGTELLNPKTGITEQRNKAIANNPRYSLFPMVVHSAIEFCP